MSKEPIINEEKIAIENAIRKTQRTIEDYVVKRLEALERIAQQQDTIIESQEKDIENYEMFVELLKKHAEAKSYGVSMTILNSEDAEEVIKFLGLKKGNENE